MKILRCWTFLAVDNFDFTRKIVKNILGEKLVKILRICIFYLLTTLISRENCKVVKIEFLDKNLTFRIVCTYCVDSNLVDNSLNSNFSWSNFDFEALTENRSTANNRKHSFMTVTKHN